MYIDGTPILRILDAVTGFGNAAPLRGPTIEDLSTTFVAICSTAYPSYQNELGVDSGSVFTLPRWT